MSGLSRPVVALKWHCQVQRMLLPSFITDQAVFFFVNMSWMCKCESSILLWSIGEKYELHTATPTTPSVVVHVCEDEQVGNPVPNDSDQDDKARAPRPKIIQTRRPDYTPRIEQWMMKKQGTQCGGCHNLSWSHWPRARYALRALEKVWGLWKCTWGGSSFL